MISLSWTQWFIIGWLYRYVRLIVNCVAHWTFRPIPLPENPTLTPADVTIIIPSIDGDGEELRETIRTCLQNDPHEIILVTINANLQRATDMARAISEKRIKVLGVQHANKRRQMARAIPEVTTKITVFADDDVSWPAKLLWWVLAAFEKPSVGGVQTSQRLRRPQHPNVWDFLGSVYLQRRNFEISATTHVDGGISCLSGRTVGYRTEIIQDEAFTSGFTNEYFLLRRYQLNADDDNFITRWVVLHGWDVQVQYHREAELSTTLENNPKYLKQCLRWSRSNWRSNLTSMFSDRVVWNKQPYSSYSLFIATLNFSALIYDPWLLYACHRATHELGWSNPACAHALVLLACWILLTKVVKILVLLLRYPQDIVFLPAQIAFAYLHGFIKYYAMCTMFVTTWGSREGADADDACRLIRVPDANGSLKDMHRERLLGKA